jgi:hypothetical protein
MPDNMEVRSLREVSIYLRQITEDIETIKEDLETERRLFRETKAKRNFVIMTSFIAPVIVTFIVNSAGVGR